MLIFIKKYLSVFMTTPIPSLEPYVYQSWPHRLQCSFHQALSLHFFQGIHIIPSTKQYYQKSILIIMSPDKLLILSFLSATVLLLSIVFSH